MMRRQAALGLVWWVFCAGSAACGGRILQGDDAIVSAFDDAGAQGISGLPPRPITPLSTSRVTSRRPTLRWQLPSGVTDVTVDLCVDRACSRPIGAPIHLVGASTQPPSDLPTGVVYWRVHPSTSTTVTSATWEFFVGARTAPVDTSWGTTLDVNGDGYADVALGAPGAHDNVGRAYIYLGGAASLGKTPAVTLDGPDGADGQFGVTVASAGDVNGDGFADLVVTAYRVSDAWRAYVYLGGAHGLAATPTKLIDPDADSHIANVASAGDMNNDGYGDIVISTQDSWSGVERVYVYLGSAGGISTTASTVMNPNGDGFDTVVSDVNGDRYADLIVGASGALTDAGTGRVELYLGSAGGVPTAVTQQLVGGSDFGTFVMSAGDVNGDGYADLLAGMHAGLPWTLDTYLGGPGGVATSPATELSGPSVAYFQSIAAAGDLNGDGYTDLVVGADGVGSGLASTLNPRVQIYLGSASGLSTMPLVTLLGPGDSQHVNSIASAGDVNGDGFADFVVAADGTATNTGLAYLYLGAEVGVAASIIKIAGPDGAGGFFGHSVCGAAN